MDDVDDLFQGFEDLVKSLRARLEEQNRELLTLRAIVAEYRRNAKPITPWHQDIERTCDDCGATFQGKAARRYCTPCRTRRQHPTREDLIDDQENAIIRLARTRDGTD